MHRENRAGAASRDAAWRIESAIEISAEKYRALLGRLRMDLVVIAILVTLLWIGSMGFYIYTSRRQRDLQAGIESLQELLDKDGSADES